MLVNPKLTARDPWLGLALILALAAALLAGCSATPKAGASTAKAAFAVAESTLSTTAPDGKLLVAESTEPITATSTPTWQFLIGSPKTDVIYAVVVQNGQGQFQEYGKAHLSAAEWAAVPAADAWKIDSDVAHEKAVALHTNGKSAAYTLAFVTYVPKASKASRVKAMTWMVTFDPAAQSSAPTSTVTVDMKTGAAAFAK